MRKYTLFYLFILFSFSFVNAQETTISKDDLLEKGEILFNQKKYKEACNLYLKSIKSSDGNLKILVSKTQKLINCMVEWEQAGARQNELKKYWNKLEEMDSNVQFALGFAVMKQVGKNKKSENKAYNIELIKKGQFHFRHKGDFCDTLVAYYTGGLGYKDLGLYDKTIKELHLFLKNYDKHQLCAKKLPFDLFKATEQIGWAYSHLAKYDSAEVYFQKNLIYSKQNDAENFIKIAQTYDNIAQVMLNSGRLKQAFDYLKLAEKIYSENGTTDDLKSATNFEHFGWYYDEIGDSTQSIRYHKKALDIRIKKHGEMHPDVAWSYHNIGASHTNCDSSIFYYKKALDIRKSILGEQHKDVAFLLHNLGKCHYSLGQYPTAKQYFLEALKMRRAVLPPNHIDIAWTYERLARTEFIKTYEEGIKYSKNAEETVGYNTPFSFENTLHLRLIANTAWQRGYLFFEWFKEDSTDITKLKEANLAYREAVNAIEREIQNLTRFDMAKDLFYEFKEIYDGVIRTSNLLWKLTDDIDHLNHLFEYAEKKKTWLVQKELQEMQSFDMTKVPDRLMTKFYQLNTAIAAFERRLSNSENIKSESDQTVTIKIHNKRLERDKLIERIREDYPAFNKARFDFTSTTIPEVQKYLAEDQSMLIFEDIDNQLFAFIIRKDTFYLMDYPTHNAARLKLTFLTLANFVNKRLASNDGDLLIELGIDFYGSKYEEIASNLYKAVFQPLEQLIKNKRVIIIPNEITYGMATFDYLLIDSKIIKGKQSYLSDRYYFSYNPSASLFCFMNRKDAAKTEGDYLGFAPFYSSDSVLIYDEFRGIETTVNPLRASGDEVFESCEIMRGKSLSGKEATKEAFIQNAPFYKYIHLATHHEANIGNRDLSFLLFSDHLDKTQDKVLYSSEVRDLQLNAELVSLIACNTDRGFPMPGTGLPGMAQAFIYAGAKSLVASKWKIRDASSSYISIEFFRNLKEGLPKDVALGEAKRKYLRTRTNSSYYDPLFWGGLILIGNTAPISP